MNKILKLAIKISTFFITECVMETFNNGIVLRKQRMRAVVKFDASYKCFHEGRDFARSSHKRRRGTSHC